MAEFLPAFDATMQHEGFYANDPLDRGGETYMGITRKNHPNWSGWEAIDREGPENVNRRDLRRLAVKFYKALYWDKVDGDGIVNQSVAEELFDTAVHAGPKQAITFLQRALNLLNRNEKYYPDILEDGIIGPLTMTTLQVSLKVQGNKQYLLKLLNVLQGAFYVELWEKDKTQEKWVGWLKRIQIGG